jgi:hypothetical protein
VNLAVGQLASYDFVQIIEDEMQLEAEEPAHRGVSALRKYQLTARRITSGSHCRHLNT